MYGDLSYEEFHRAALRAKLDAPAGSTLCSMRIEELWSLARQRQVRQRDWSPFMHELQMESRSDRIASTPSFPPPPRSQGGLFKALAAAADEELAGHNAAGAASAAAGESTPQSSGAAEENALVSPTPSAAFFAAGLEKAISQLPTPPAVRAVLSPLPQNLPRNHHVSEKLDLVTCSLQLNLACDHTTLTSPLSGTANTPSTVDAAEPAACGSTATEGCALGFPSPPAQISLTSPTLDHARTHLAAVLGGLRNELKAAELNAIIGVQQAAVARHEQNKLVCRKSGPPGWLIAIAHCFCLPLAAPASRLEWSGS